MLQLQICRVTEFESLTNFDNRLVAKHKQQISKHPVLIANIRIWCGIPRPLIRSTPRDLFVRLVKIYIIYCLPVNLMLVLLLSNFHWPVPVLNFSS
jgi:hypothetical protein